MSKSNIRMKFGPDGIRDFAETLGGVGAITDDTQMTLFNAEGHLLEYRRSRGTGTPPDFLTSI